MVSRARIGYFLRTWADRIDRRGAPRAMSYTFTPETGEGIRFRENGKGCRLWYLGEDSYDKAHTEADSAANDAWEAESVRLLGVMRSSDSEAAREAAREFQRRVMEGAPRA